jgi:hypothetical protein
MTDGDGFVTLVCPPGSWDAPISQGTVAYEPWHDHASGKWLVRVPEDAAQHVCFNAGFYRAPADLQRGRE